MRPAAAPQPTIHPLTLAAYRDICRQSEARERVWRARDPKAYRRLWRQESRIAVAELR